MTPFQILLQPGKLSGGAWDDVTGAVSQVCGMVSNPGEFMRGLLGVDAGGLVNESIDATISKVTAGFTEHVALACHVANALFAVVNLLKGPSAPDVYVAYATFTADGTPLQKRVSSVYKDATYDDLKSLDGLPSLTIPCNDLETQFGFGVVDRETDEPLTADSVAPEDELIGSIHGTMRNVDPRAIDRGFTYLIPAEPNGVIAVGVTLKRK
jgi:multidrug transporter EmrE-like cation transporter